MLLVALVGIAYGQKPLEDLSKSMRVSMELMQEKIFDCSTIFNSIQNLISCFLSGEELDFQEFTLPSNGRTYYLVKSRRLFLASQGSKYAISTVI